MATTVAAPGPIVASPLPCSVRFQSLHPSICWEIVCKRFMPYGRILSLMTHRICLNLRDSDYEFIVGFSKILQEEVMVYAY